MKALQIVEHPYRCTVEEQDDPALWFTHAMRFAGAQLGVLLRGNAVNYATRRQQVQGLTIGGKAQTHPPDLVRDVRSLLERDVAVFSVAEDVEARGIGKEELLPGIELISRDALADTIARYDRVWHW